MNKLKKVIFYIENLFKYVTRGGVTYYNVTSLAPSCRFEGKTILITGGSSGFGKKMAADYLSEGANVIITGRDEIKLNRVKSELNNQKLKVMVWDIGDLTILEDKLEEAIKYLGKIDIFINNAGVYSKTHGLESEIDDWNSIVSINLTSVFFMMKAEANYLLKEYKLLGGGKIINITSVGAFKPRFDSYYMSKNAIAFISEGLAITLAPYNICINCVAPGEALTSSSMCKDYGKVGNNNYYEHQPNHRYTRVDDVSSMCMYLSSEDANNVTGLHIPVDGGWSINR